MEPIVEVRDVCKRYGAIEALKGVSLEIPRGKIFGLLGPNGAGKTTLVEILEGMRPADAGTVRVCGFDPQRDAVALHRKLGAQLQATALPDTMRVAEALELFARLYEAPPGQAEKLLARFDLARLSRRKFTQLSGGEKQRLAVALSLINDPELVILDEPTAALDPNARKSVHDSIELLRQEGRSVILCTHYLDEAQKLCDEILILAKGQIAAHGTPEALLARTRRRAELVLICAREVPRETWLTVPGAELLEHGGARVKLAVRPIGPAVSAACAIAERDGGGVVDLHLFRPTLDDVFLELTGEKAVA
jgi:ABC-2 type transport system ATP-binding protein